MFFYLNFWELLILLFLYVLIYNFSLVLLFWTIKQTLINDFKTINSFSKFKTNDFMVFVLSVLFLSIAGVPPFLGFFTKLIILISLLNSTFFIFYFFFFILLFFSLYFYIQNIRFLHSSQNSKISYPFFFNVRVTTLYFYAAYLTMFFLIFGFFFFDDFLLYVFFFFI